MSIQTNIPDNNNDFSFTHSESGIVLAGPYMHHLSITPLFTQGSSGTSPLSSGEQNDKWSYLLLWRCSCPEVQFVSILQRRKGQVTQLTDSLWGWARRPEQVRVTSRPVTFMKTAYSWIHKPGHIASLRTTVRKEQVTKNTYNIVSRIWSLKTEACLAVHR